MGLSASVYERLPATSILKSLPGEDLETLTPFFVAKRLTRGEILFKQGDPGSSMVVVIMGMLKACTISSQGKEIVFDYFGPGDVIGEIAVFDGEPRTATVLATEPSEILLLHRRDLLAALERRPRIALAIIQVLCKKIRRTDALFEDHAALSTGPKLARGLLRLAAEYRTRQSKGGGLVFRMSQSDLGNYVSASRENVNRQLREWAADGLIRLSRGQIVVLDEEGLQAIAGYER